MGETYGGDLWGRPMGRPMGETYGGDRPQRGFIWGWMKCFERLTIYL